MVVRGRIGDAEADDHLIEKIRLGETKPQTLKIPAGLKNEVVAAGLQRRAFQERLFATAVGIGHRACQRRAMLAGAPDADGYSGGRPAARRIQHMRRQAAQFAPPVARREGVLQSMGRVCAAQRGRERWRPPHMPEEIASPSSSGDRAAFVARYGGVYEHSPWVAEEAYDAGIPFAEHTPEGLARRFATIVAAAGRARQMALIRAHPDLAGRLAVDGGLTDSSRSEQAGAGLDRCTPAELARFQALNDAYKAKFGFPFILAVAGRSRADILAAFEARIANDPETEFSTALREIDRIALLRLKALDREKPGPPA